MFKLLICLLITFSSGLFAASLDDLLKIVSQDLKHNPYLGGEIEAKSHPQYSRLIELGHSFGSKLEWVDSVALRVLELPYDRERLKINPEDELIGWFDEIVIPNLIILDRTTNLATLIHELRHAVHLGTHRQISHNWFDRTLQINKKKIKEFHTKLNQSHLSKVEKTDLKRLSTRLLRNQCT